MEQQRTVTIDLYDAGGARTRSRHQHASGKLEDIAREMLAYDGSNAVTCVITDEDSGEHAEANREENPLTAERVERVFTDCLFKADELVDGKPTIEAIKVNGITFDVGFHPGRVEANRVAIGAMVDELPEKFAEGWSFLNACDTRSGEQWTSFHVRMSQLFMLGEAIGRVKMVVPREMWAAMPGGMPYYQVLSP